VHDIEFESALAKLNELQLVTTGTFALYASGAQMPFRGLYELSLDSPVVRTQMVLRGEFVDWQLLTAQRTSVQRIAQWPLSSAAVIGAL
jgi:hypothetical protein